MKNYVRSTILFLLLAVGLSSCMCYGPGYGYRGHHGGYGGHRGGGYGHHHGGGHRR